MRPLPMSFNWLTRSPASQAQLFPWKISKSANAFSGFPQLVDGSDLKQLCAFLTQQGRHAPPSLTSARLNVITTALSTTLPALSRVTYTPCFCFPLFCLTFLFGMTVPEPNAFRQLDTFPRLRNCTPKLPYILHIPCFFCGRLSLVVFAPSTAAYTFRFAHRTVFAVFCVCCFVLARVPCFFACQFSRNYPHQFFRGGHSYIVDLTFRITTWRFLLTIVFRTWDLVCINVSFTSRDFVCLRMTSIRIAFGFVHRHGHHAFRKSSCVSLAHAPRWLFLLSRHRKSFLLLLIRNLL